MPTDVIVCLCVTAMATGQVGSLRLMSLGKEGLRLNFKKLYAGYFVWGEVVGGGWHAFIFIFFLASCF